jgi:hypothetical protein
MALDSKAHFEQRLTELELHDLLPRFTAKGWTSAGAFAFSTTFVPGSADDAAFKRQVLEPLVGLEHVEGPQAPSIRRLFYESYTMAVAELKRKVEANGEELPRRLPTAERAALLVNQQTRLLGLVLEDDLECSNALIDKGIQMKEDNLLSYISWEQCTTRAQELANTKAIKEYRTDGGGFLREVSTKAETAANTSSDLRLRVALQRRGLMLDQCELMSYANHEKLASFLFLAYMRPALPGFAAVSLDQMLRADTEVFRVLVQRTRSGIRRLPDGTLPLDNHVQTVLDSVAVNRLLLPPQGRAAASAATTATTAADKDSRGQRKRKNAAERKKNSASSGAQPDKKNDDKKGDAKRAKRMPEELIGCENSVGGKFVCYGYNMRCGCPSKDVKPGARCAKGFHLCCVSGCGKDHSKVNH